jgi:hypothetical protein
MTKYFTQWDDFSVDTVGTNVVGWTTRGTAGPNSYAPAYGTPAIKRRYLKFACNSAVVPLRNVISWNAIDADANRANVELLSCFSKDATTCTDLTLVSRGVGATATAATEAYVARLEMSGTIYLCRRFSTTAILTIVSAAFTFSAGKSYFARFRVNGTTLQLKVWDAALGMAGEPAAWNLTTTDATFSAAGWVGLGGFDGGAGNSIAPWNFLAVGTNGDSAVCPRTNAEFAAWLARQDVMRCVLAEMSATGYNSAASPYTKTVNAYISNHGFTSQQQDTPSLRHYDGIIAGIPTLNRQMATALSGEATTGFGNLVVTNPGATLTSGGIRDNWLRMRWNRNNLRLYLGDPSWPKHDFRLIVYGRLKMPTAPTKSTINFPITDLSDALEAQLPATAITTGEYAGQWRPRVFGNVGIVEPPKTDTANLIFTVSENQWSAPLPNSTVVLDNGNTIRTNTFTVSAVNTGTGEITASANHGMLDGYTFLFLTGTPPLGLALSTLYHVIGVTPGTDKFKLSLTYAGGAITGGAGTTGAGFRGYGWRIDNSNGTFTLVSQPAGRVMVLGAYDDVAAKFTSADLYDRIVFGAFGLSLNFKDSDTFNTLQTDEFAASIIHGLWFDSRKHLVKECVLQVATKTYTWYSFSFDGLMQVGAIKLPAATAVLSFTESDVVKDTLRMIDVIRPLDVSKTPTSYSPAFVTGGPLANAAALTNGLSQYLSQLLLYLPTYSYGAAGIPLDDHPDQSDSNTAQRIELTTPNSFSATQVQSSIAALYLHKLGVFEFVTTLRAMTLNIGDTISLTHSRLDWKLWTGSDDASPDNTADVDSRLAVVIGIDVDIKVGTVKLKVFRRIPGNYPIADITG